MFRWLYFLSLIYCLSFHSLLFFCLISLIWMLVLLCLTHTNRRQTAEQQQFKRLTHLTSDKHFRFSDKQVQLVGRRRDRFFISLCTETRCSAGTRCVPLGREITGSKAKWYKELLTSAAGTRENTLRPQTGSCQRNLGTSAGVHGAMLLLCIFTGVLGIDPDLIVVLQSEIGLVGGEAESW